MAIHRYFDVRFSRRIRRYVLTCPRCGFQSAHRVERLNCPRCFRVYDKPPDRGYWQRWDRRDLKNRLGEMLPGAEIVQPWSSQPGLRADIRYVQDIIDGLPTATGSRGPRYYVRATLRGIIIRKMY